jgi:2'-5' RNA ligase
MNGFSLWMVPGAAEHERLAALIRSLARRFGGPVFDPHVTLLAGVPGPAKEAVARARDAVRSSPPLRLRFAGPEAGESYFRCLYLRVEPTPELLSLHAAAREAFGRRDEPPFFPHLSLLYARPPAPLVAGEVRDESLAGFDCRRVDVYSTEGEVAAWRRVGRLPMR